jgi:hypothetical protein
VLQRELHVQMNNEFSPPAEIYEMDSLRSRLATLAATAFHRGSIDVQRFNDLAEFAGIGVADRERLLAITATHSRQAHEHEDSRPTTEAIASSEKKLP